MRVLIAEDEALTRMELRTMLRDLGHTVVAVAVDGKEAFALACEKRPDLAILDLNLPRLDGLTVAEAISRHCPVPVLILSTHSERDRVERAAATASVQACLVKPVRERDLAPMVYLAVARFAEWQALCQEAAGRQEALAAREVVARAKQVLMQGTGLSEEDAFLEIQQRARSQGQKMRQAAEEILQSNGQVGRLPPLVQGHR